MATLSDRIKTLKDENNLTFRQMEEKTGVSKSAIIDWVTHGNYPNSFNLMAIAMVFDVSTDWLLGISDFRKVKR